MESGPEMYKQYMDAIDGHGFDIPGNHWEALKQAGLGISDVVCRLLCIR